MCIPDVSMIFACRSASQCEMYLYTNSTQIYPTPPTSPTVCPLNTAKQVLVLRTTVEDQYFV